MLARLFSGSAIARRALAVCSALSFGGCAVLSPPLVSIQGAHPDDTLNAATVRIDPSEPVLLRAVDGELIPSIQISNYLRPLTYALPAGKHTLWLSELPFGLPFILQHIDCYTMEATLAPGKRYSLWLDPKIKLPVLSSSGSAAIEAIGIVVDQPLLVERGSKWR